MLGRTTRRLATLALAGGAALTLQATPALAYQEEMMMEESAALCTWASQTYSPGAQILYHDAVFECLSSGSWKRLR